jgi:hypothetical protein
LVVTAREELLSTGRLGRAGAELLYRTVRLVAVGYGFPPPKGSRRWEEDAVIDIAHSFLEGERGARRLRDIAVRSVDDRSFERLFDAAVHNFLRDLSRQTDFGKLVLRVKEILRDEDEFEQVSGKSDRWTLSGGESEPSTVSPGALTAAIAGAKINIPKWSSDRRDAPLADRPSFVLLMTRVLAAAEGSLVAHDLARVLTSRLDHRRTALTTTMDIEELVSEHALVDGDSGASAVAELHAADIFDALSDRERIILADPETTVRDLARQLDVGKSQAALLREWLFDRLRRELDGDEDLEEVATHLAYFCGEWIRQWTTEKGATSDD